MVSRAMVSSAMVGRAMASRAIVKCDDDLPVVDADLGKHARALRVQRSCACVRVARRGVRPTRGCALRVHLCAVTSRSRGFVRNTATTIPKLAKREATREPMLCETPFRTLFPNALIPYFPPDIPFFA